MIDTMLYPRHLSKPALLDPDYRDSAYQVRSIRSFVEFNAILQTNLFNKLKKQEFSGELVLETAAGITSVLYFYLGRIIYAGGGVHPLRRWQRHLREYCPRIQDEHHGYSWTREYGILGQAIQQNIIQRDQVNYLVRSLICEVLFDLTQARSVNYKIFPQKYTFIPIVAINPEQIVTQVWKLWQAWQDTKLGDRSPNSAPIVKSAEALQQKTSELTFKFLCQRINGEKTLRDLAVELN